MFKQPVSRGGVQSTRGYTMFLSPEDDGGAGEVVITPQIQALIDSEYEKRSAPLKAKRDELLGAVRQQKDELKKYDGIDPDTVRNILSKFASEEEAGLIAKGDIDGVLNKRTERMKADFEKKLQTEVQERDRFIAANKRLSARALSEAILKAATKAGALPEAMEDVVLRAQGTWTVNDDGEVVAKNGDEIVLGKDGKTPLTPIEWAESLRETAPHLWPKAQGANAMGSGNGANPKPDLSKLSPAARLTEARKRGAT